jgi:hypothetical protein
MNDNDDNADYGDDVSCGFSEAKVGPIHRSGVIGLSARSVVSVPRVMLFPVHTT